MTPPFAQVVLALSDALNRRDLTFPQFGLAAFLALDADWRTGEAVYTLRALTDAVAWPWGPDKLLDDLKALRRAGWIEFDSRQGQRKPYVFRVTTKLVRGRAASGATSDRNPPSPPEVSSGDRKLDNPEGDGAEPDRAHVRPPAAGSPKTRPDETRPDPPTVGSSPRVAPCEDCGREEEVYPYPASGRLFCVTCSAHRLSTRRHAAS